MNSSDDSQSYFLVCCHLAFVRVRQYVRSICDMTGLGPSHDERMTFVVILSAVISGVLLVLSLQFASLIAAVMVCSLPSFFILFVGYVFISLNTDEELVTLREQLLEEKADAHIYRKASKAQKLKLKEKQRLEEVQRLNERVVYPGPSPVQAIGVWLFVLLVLSVPFLIIWAIMSDRAEGERWEKENPNWKPARTYEAPTAPDDALLITGRERLKNTLRDPSSLDIIAERLIKPGRYGSRVGYYAKYRAKNGFGGYTVEEYYTE